MTPAVIQDTSIPSLAEAFEQQPESEANMESGSTIMYQPLHGSDIRVIAIQPSQQYDSPVSCTLVQAPLESLSFKALSYVWGDPKVTREVLVDETPFSVTVNLEAYLRKVAQDGVKGSLGDNAGEYLWVDAICIDQQNTEERNAQVQRMGSIYSVADEVIIWLGNGGTHIHLGIERIQEHAKVMRQLGGIRAFADQEKRAVASGLFKDIMKGDSDTRKGLFELFEFPWWTRAWVLQELALAKTVRFLCNQDTISFEDIYSAVLHYYTSFSDDPLQTTNALNLSSNEEDLFSRALNAINTRALFEHNFDDRHSRTTLQSLLSRTERVKATDPRDKIYGLLGMISDKGKELIKPSYELDVDQVYMDIVLWHLHQYDNLSILSHCFAGSSESQLVLPSWVPHWEPKQKEDEGPVLLYWEEYEDHISKSKTLPYHASGDLSLSSHPWSADKVAGTLSLTGARLGTVTFLSNAAHMPSSVVQEDAFVVAKEWLALGEHFGKTYPFTGESMKLVIRRTVVGDFHNRTTHLPQGVKYMERGFALMLPDDPPVEMGGVNWDYKDSILGYIQQVDKRRLAATSNGWIGLVPETAAIGDQVVVLIGGAVLYVVREKSRETEPTWTDLTASCIYSLVGEAYFHGFMDGQAVEGQELSIIILGK